MTRSACRLCLLCWMFLGSTLLPGAIPCAAGAEAPARAPANVLTRAPVLQKFVEATYPPEAEAQRISGTVKLQIDLNAQGTVTQVTVLEPAGHGFDEAAVAAVRQFLFEPAQIDDHPAAVRISYNYNFAFKPPPQAAPEREEAPREGPINLAGQVRVRGIRRPMPAVEVALPELGRTALTDEQGNFSFRDVPVGPVKVVIVEANFERFETQETLALGKKSQVIYYLMPRYFSQYETVVRGRGERKEVSQTTITAEEVQKLPGTSGDALKVLQNLPGVARAPFNGGAIVIRGVSSADSGIFLDGERIPLLYHFGGLTAVFNSDLLDSIDYLPGNYSVYYGDRIGGVVDVKSRSPRSDAVHGYANINLVDTSLLLEAPLAKGLSLAVAYRRSYIDALLKLAPASAISNLSLAPRYSDGQFKLEWKPDSHHTLSLVGLTDNDQFGLLIQRPASSDPNVSGRFNLEDGFTQLRLRHQYRNGALHLDTTVLGGPTFFSFSIGASRGLSISAHEYDLRHTLEYELKPWVTLATGLDVTYTRATVNAEIQRPPPEGEQFTPAAIAPIITAHSFTEYFLPSVWAEARFKPLPGLLVTPGLRAESFVYDYQTQRDFALSPRLGARYQLTKQWAIKGGAGIYHGAGVQDEPTREFGNPNLRSKRSNQFSMGTEWTPNPGFLGSVEGYYNTLSSLVVSNPAGVPPYLLSEGRGRVYGVELFLRQAITERFFGWISYSLSRSERQDHIYSPVRLFDFDQTHILTILGSYKLPHGWQVGARFRYVSGNLFTPVVSASRYDNTDVYVPSYGPPNSERVPPFHQADVRVDKTWVFDAWSLDVFLDLQNAYNHASIEGETYNFDYRQRGYFRGLPVLPVLGLKASF